MNTDVLKILDDVPDPERAVGPSWRVLVVDDDPDVHEVTTFALSNVRILDRRLELVHVFDADAAFEAIERDPEVTVALVDVVMERDQAGLDLVRRVRDAGHDLVRIVLRTGQPGYAPELEVLQRHDINAYAAKSELDRTRLISLLTTSIRTYGHLRALEDHRRGLERIVAMTGSLVDRHDLGRFAPAVLTSLASLVDRPVSGLVAFAAVRDRAADLADFTVISAAGAFRDAAGAHLDALAVDPGANVFRSVDSGRVHRDVGGLTLRFSGADARHLFVFLEYPGQPSEATRALLDVFAGDVAVCFQNLQLLRTLDALAFVDPKIEVPNENAFEMALQEHFDTDGAPLTVGLVALEDFASAAGVFGTDYVHGMLAQFYVRLWQEVPSVIAAARVGDETFAFASRATDLGDVVLESLSQWQYDDGASRMHVVGTTALLPVSRQELARRTLTPKKVMERVRSTLAFARDGHRGECSFYDSKLIAAVEDRVRTQTEFARALKTREGLSVAVQPIVDASTMRVVSGEALARWTLDGEAVSPGEFIPLAEACGLSFELLGFVIETVGAWAAQRRDRGEPPLCVSVNVAVRDIERAQFAEAVLGWLAEAELEPAAISFEVTERDAIHDASRVASALQCLADRGYSIALDDFGTGHASLALIERLPIHTLKIDRMFVSSLTPENARRSIAAATLSIARSFGLSVVAEGIETVTQHQALVFLGCDRCQGYLYGRPGPIEAFDGPVASAIIG